MTAADHRSAGLGPRNAARSDRHGHFERHPPRGGEVRRHGIAAAGQPAGRRRGADRNRQRRGADRRTGRRQRRRWGDLLLAVGPDADRRQHRHPGRRPAEGAHHAEPAAQRRADERLRRHRADDGGRGEADARHRPLCRAPRRMDRGQHRRAARRAFLGRASDRPARPDLRALRCRRRAALRRAVPRYALCQPDGGRAEAWSDPAAAMPGWRRDRPARGLAAMWLSASPRATCACAAAWANRRSRSTRPRPAMAASSSAAAPLRSEWASRTRRC